MLSTENLHDVLCQAGVLAGGIPCEKFLPNEKGRKLADLVFPDYGLLVEVKSITADRGNSPRLTAVLSEMYNAYVVRGEVDPIEGRQTVLLKDLPPQLAWEFLQEIGPRVRHEIKVANRQIRETAERLKWSDSMGVVLIVTPAHFWLHARIVSDIVIRTLTKDSFRSINGAVVFDAWTLREGEPDRMLMAQPVSSPDRALPPIDLMERIAINFAALSEQLTGRSVVVVPVE